MRVGSLFSGIGGMDLGLERAGMEVVWQVEIDPFCQKVLGKHWPDVKRYGDVYGVVTEGLEYVDVVCGGVPCQPFSSASAGKGRGTKDDRWLWPQMRRIVQGIRPRYVLVEEVAGFDGPGLETMVSDMEADGYEVLPVLEVPACAFGHDHWRKRLWILGHTNKYSKPWSPVNAETSGVHEDSRRGGPGHMGDTHGPASRMERLGAIGNAVCPDIPEWIGRRIMDTT